MEKRSLREVSMADSELVMAIIVFAFSGILLRISIIQFRQKGFLLNNAYIYASKEQRKKMDKKPYYRQSVFYMPLPTL